MIRAAVLAVLLACGTGPAASETVAEPESYRMDAYRAPVPATLKDATVIDDDAALALWKTARVVFVDVLPRPPRPENLPEDTVWIDKPRQTIPGAMWLPNTGFGALPDETEAYFADGLATATAGDTAAPVVFFCRSDCWMSWNAAKRALKAGYTNVFWYPDGTDGWQSLDQPTQETQPWSRP